MNALKLTLPVLALAVGACGSPASQPSANGAAAANQAQANAAAPGAGNASAAASGPLSVYVGRVVYDQVDGVAFVDHPLVRSAVEAAVSDAAVRRWVLRSDVTTNPIALRGGRLLANGCESHNCGPHHWSILIDPAGTSAEVCYARNTTGDRGTWYVGGRPGEERPGSCPQTGEQG